LAASLLPWLWSKLAPKLNGAVLSAKRFAEMLRRNIGSATLLGPVLFSQRRCFLQLQLSPSLAQQALCVQRRR
jgi:hypothetical protein